MTTARDLIRDAITESIKVDRDQLLGFKEIKEAKEQILDELMKVLKEMFE